MAALWIVGDDRWGNRWAGTVYWIVRCDHAKRLHPIPWKDKPGKYTKGEFVGPLKDERQVEKVIRDCTRGRPMPVVERPGLSASVFGPDGANASVYERSDGALSYVNPKLSAACFGRVPGVRLYQFVHPTKPHPVVPIVGAVDGQPVALLMPIRMGSLAPEWSKQADSMKAAA